MREIMLIAHFLGLAMGLGTSFAFMFLGIASSKMEAGERLKFTLNTFGISLMGHIGITLLIVSGLYLITPYWKILSSLPLLMVKLGLVLVLATLIGIITVKAGKARKGDVAQAEKYIKEIQPLGKIAMLVGLTIVGLAVYVFH